MPFTSEAIVYHKRNAPVAIEEFTIPDSLAPNDIVVKTEYASINPIDVKLQSVNFSGRKTHTLTDFAGTVAAVGSAAEAKFPVGEKVYGSVVKPSNERYVGSYTILSTEKDSIAKIPPKLSFEEASGLGVVYGTAYELLERANNDKQLTADSRVLVLGGATSVGSITIELAKLFYGVKHVVATCSPTSADYVKEYGATDIINYRVNDLSAEFKKYVEKQGEKFDTILDCVGGYDALRVSNDILKPCSEGSSYYSLMGDTPPSDSYARTMVNALTNIPRMIMRTKLGKWYGINYAFFMVSRGKWTEAAYEIFSIPGMRVPIDSVHSLKDIQTAWDKVNSTKARGKVIVKMQA